MLRRIVLASFLALAFSPAKADSCSSVVPGAQMGPSPTFRNWPWTDACYISWPGGYINGLNARFTYEPKCQQVPGFLHFEGDFGSNKNTCVFKLESNARPVQPQSPVSTQQDNCETRELSPLERYNNAMAKADVHYKNGLLYLEMQLWRDANRQLTEARLAYVEATLPYLLPNLTKDEDARYAFARKQGNLAVCLEFIADAIANRSQSTAQFAQNKCDKVKSDRLIDQYVAKLNATFDLGAQGERPAVAQPSNKTAPVVSDSCIDATPSRKVSSACDFKDDVPMFETSIRTSPTPGCPAQLTAGYRTPYESSEQRLSLTSKYQKVWTCAAGPSGLRVIP